MRKKVIVLLCVNLAVLAFGTAQPQEPITLYVSPHGNDKWSGTRKTPNLIHTNGPLASLEGARNAIRRLKARGTLDRPVMVRVLGGTYRLDQPFVLSPEDSGTTDCKIVYLADSDKRPVFTGGREIRGWNESQEGRWTVELPDVKSGRWNFQSLFVNGERRTRARTPNEGEYFRAAGNVGPGVKSSKDKGDPRDRISFRFKPGDIKPWENLNDVNVVVFHAWATDRHRIASVNVQTHVVEFTGPSRWPFGRWGITDQRYYVENYPGALDAPGEWYLDRRSGVLTYIPLPGETTQKAEVVAPVTLELVRFDGNADGGRFVEHIELSGLRFQYTDWTLGEKGYTNPQAAPDVQSAITLAGARRCVLKNLEVAHVGGYGIELGHGCKDNRIEQCHIHDLGAGGVKLGEVQLPDGEAGRAERNTVHNCYIHDGGHIYHTAVGVWVGKSSFNTISHNEICEFYYTGISVGWSWGYQPSSAHHNLIEYNHVHHLGFGVLSDMGGIYTLGVSPGTVIRNNIFHHVESYSYGGWGIYTDEGSSDILIENNLVYRTKDGSFHQHYGRDNLIRNNIWADSRERQIVRTRSEPHRSFVFEHNIVYFTSGVLLGSNWSGTRDNFQLDYNLYWNTTGTTFTFGKLTFEQWKAQGQDVHSRIADPKFVAPEKYDFRLAPDSPAMELGFKPIDFRNVGLVGPREWVEQPRIIKRKWPDPPVGKK